MKPHTHPHQNYLHPPLSAQNLNYFTLPHVDCLINPTSLPGIQKMWYVIYVVLCNSPTSQQDENPPSAGVKRFNTHALFTLD